MQFTTWFLAALLAVAVGTADVAAHSNLACQDLDTQMYYNERQGYFRMPVRCLTPPLNNNVYYTTYNYHEPAGTKSFPGPRERDPVNHTAATRKVGPVRGSARANPPRLRPNLRYLDQINGQNKNGQYKITQIVRPANNRDRTKMVQRRAGETFAFAYMLNGHKHQEPRGNVNFYWSGKKLSNAETTDPSFANAAQSPAKFNALFSPARRVHTNKYRPTDLRKGYVASPTKGYQKQPVTRQVLNLPQNCGRTEDAWGFHEITLPRNMEVGVHRFYYKWTFLNEWNWCLGDPKSMQLPADGHRTAPDAHNRGVGSHDAHVKPGTREACDKPFPAGSADARRFPRGLRGWTLTTKPRFEDAVLGIEFYDVMYINVLPGPPRPERPAQYYAYFRQNPRDRSSPVKPSAFVVDADGTRRDPDQNVDGTEADVCDTDADCLPSMTLQQRIEFEQARSLQQDQTPGVDGGVSGQPAAGDEKTVVTSTDTAAASAAADKLNKAAEQLASAASAMADAQRQQHTQQSPTSTDQQPAAPAASDRSETVNVVIAALLGCLVVVAVWHVIKRRNGGNSHSSSDSMYTPVLNGGNSQQDQLRRHARKESKESVGYGNGPIEMSFVAADEPRSLRRNPSVTGASVLEQKV